MLPKARPAIGVVVAFVLVSLAAGSAKAQTDSRAALETNLKAQYKLTAAKIDNGAVSVVQGGTVLVIQADGILGVPPSESNVPQTTFKVEENVVQPGTASRSSRLLRGGEKIYVTKIDVDSQNDKVLLAIVECDVCNGADKPSSLMARLAFEFPKGYLESADSSQVLDVIDEILIPEDALPAPTLPSAPEAEAPTPTPEPTESTQATFSVRHRHLNMFGSADTASNSGTYYYCSGDLSISADGTVRYDCTGTDDPSGRCDHISLPAGSLKQAKVGYNGALHIATNGRGNFDFFADATTIQNALAAMTPVVGKASVATAATTAPPPPPAASSCADYESCMKQGATALEQPEGGAQALAEFQKASQLQPSKGQPLVGKGDAYLQMGQYDNAAYMWDKGLGLGATLSIPVCHAGMMCGDTGELVLGMKEIAFINKKGEKKFTATPSTVTSEGPVFWGKVEGREGYYVELHTAGKDYRFYYSPIAVKCSMNIICPEPWRTQQKIYAGYIHNALEKLKAGTFVSETNKP